MNEKSFAERVKAVEKKVEDFLVGSKDTHDNAVRRKLYSEVDFLKLDLEEIQESSEGKAVWPSKEQFDALNDRLNKVLKCLPLQAIKRSMKESVMFYNPVFIQLETLIRFVGVACSIFLAGAFLSLPILLLRAFDIAFKNDPYAYWSERLKKVVTTTVLFQAGLDVKVEGLSRELLQDIRCFIMAFTHACNIDGFLVAGTCPVRQLAFGKKELFVAPFFSWLSLAIGGIPVDRGHRDRAIQALEYSVQSAQADSHSNMKLCIAIAPEGSRSQSGQLLPFKKGAFYMWESLHAVHAPLIPFVIYGAYELYHPKHWVNNTGRIVVRYLPPITFDPTLSKAAMSRKVRRAFLTALADCPPYPEVGGEVSPLFKVLALLSNILVALVTYIIWGVVDQLVVAVGVGLGLAQNGVVGWGVKTGILTALVVGITVALYVYYVYVMYWGMKSEKKKV